MQTWRERIKINPELGFGKPCIKDSLITVRDILGWLASDMYYEEILDGFPELKRPDILAALTFTGIREANTKILITL